MRNNQKTNKRNKTPANKEGWCLHPTKGWKRTFKLQRLHERFLNEQAARSDRRTVRSEDMTYTLKKLELEEGKDSMLPTGYSTRGEFLSLFDYETDEVEHGVELSEVREGWQIILKSFRDYHRTSKIREIVAQDENSVVFRTQTSLYELIKHEE